MKPPFAPEGSSFSEPLVSICIPTYNAEATIAETISSVLQQTYRHLEVIVVDNASTDSTVRLVEAFRDPRLRLYRNSENLGGERNYTRAVELASGEYTAVFHADDVYAPTIVEREVRTFEAHAEVGAVFTLANYINASGKTIRKAGLPRALRVQTTYDFPSLMVSVLQHGNFLVCPSAMVKTELYKSLLPFDVGRFGTSADLDMWLRVVSRSPIAVLNEHLTCYRISKDQGSYSSRYLRTEPADFLNVMDHYLEHKLPNLRVPRKALAGYEFLRAIDDTRRAVNYLIKGEIESARALLVSSTRGGKSGSWRNLRRPRLVLYWFAGCSLRPLLFLGFGKVLRQPLHWLLYTWIRRRYS